MKPTNKEIPSWFRAHATVILVLLCFAGPLLCLFYPQVGLALSAFGIFLIKLMEA